MEVVKVLQKINDELVEIKFTAESPQWIVHDTNVSNVDASKLPEGALVIIDN